jgi:hypothetical protein
MAPLEFVKLRQGKIRFAALAVFHGQSVASKRVLRILLQDFPECLYSIYAHHSLFRCLRNSTLRVFPIHLTALSNASQLGQRENFRSVK